MNQDTQVIEKENIQVATEEEVRTEEAAAGEKSSNEFNVPAGLDSPRDDDSSAVVDDGNALLADTSLPQSGALTPDMLPTKYIKEITLLKTEHYKCRKAQEKDVLGLSEKISNLENSQTQAINDLAGSLNQFAAEAVPVLKSLVETQVDSSKPASVTIVPRSDVEGKLSAFSREFDSFKGFVSQKLEEVINKLDAKKAETPDTRLVSKEDKPSRKRRQDMPKDLTKKECYCCGGLGHTGEDCQAATTGRSRRVLMASRGRCISCALLLTDHGPSGCRFARRKCQKCPPEEKDHFHLNGVCIHAYPDSPNQQMVQAPVATMIPMPAAPLAPQQPVIQMAQQPMQGGAQTMAPMYAMQQQFHPQTTAQGTFLPTGSNTIGSAGRYVNQRPAESQDARNAPKTQLLQIKPIPSIFGNGGQAIGQFQHLPVAQQQPVQYQQAGQQQQPIYQGQQQQQWQ